MNLQKPSLDPCQDVPAGGRSVTFNKLLRILYGISSYKQHLVTRRVTETVVGEKNLTLEIRRNKAQKFSSYFTVNNCNFHRKDRPVKFIY